MDDEVVAVVIDNGSALIKAGFTGDDSPRAVFPSVVGKPKHQGIMVGVNYVEPYVGDEARSKRGVLSLNLPIKRGVITDWNDLERIWFHTFYNELKVAPEEHPVILTEAPLNTKANRARMAQIMFETLNTPALYIKNQACLALFAAGKTTGIILDSGSDITHSVPIYEGYEIPHAVFRISFGGRDLTEYMGNLLMQSGFYLTCGSERALIEDIKEKMCYVAHDYDASMSTVAVSSEVEKKYELANGIFIKLSSERITCPEALFHPGFLGRKDQGVHEALLSSIKACDASLQNELYENIVLCGGSTLFQGFPERLEMELNALAPHDTLVRVIARDDRKYSTWIGGSILGSLNTFSEILISKEEYDQTGAKVVHKKCF